ncbi:MAG: glycosyltransferase family 2 protein [Paludibacteraceae bacterium]
MKEASIILSILVITHNQRELLKRCLDSVLGQKLNVPFEVIVSDDRSDDGTAEYMADLQDQITKDQVQIANLTQLFYTRCNSNDCDPKNVSERCGWNKLNVYNHARGKYFVNIDADDFLRSNDIYQAQLDMLEAHPECSMCMQDVWQVNEGESVGNGKRWPSYGKLKNGQILSAKEIITTYRALNQCYMIHRHQEADCGAIYGKYFDDTIITIHHLQYGSCVYLDRADYVWIRYKNSITMTLDGDDNYIEHGVLELHHIRFVPALASECMQAIIPSLIRMFKHLAEKNFHWQLTDRSQMEFKETPGRIYCVFSKNQSTIWERMYLRYVRLIVLLYKRMGLTNWKYLYGLLTSREMANKIDWNK